MRNISDVRIFVGNWLYDERAKTLEVSIMPLATSLAELVYHSPAVESAGGDDSAIQGASREASIESRDDPVLRESRVRLYSAALST
jgi:hypothetical protein